LIQAASATLEYDDHGKTVFACRGIDLTIEAGEFIGILGPSGSGKSSLLYLLSGLKTPTFGTVAYRGAILSELDEDQRSRLRRKEFGFVFQQPYLVGYLTAKENVGLASDQDASAAAERLLAELGLSDQMERLPHELSVGERQRVCVARALIGEPMVVFADEPTAALDHATGLHVVELLDRHRGGGSLVMVTHDPTMLSAADRVLQIAEGRIVAA
jgi:putative ABC transport system ATP-binding protein